MSLFPEEPPSRVSGAASLCHSYQDRETREALGTAYSQRVPHTTLFSGREAEFHTTVLYAGHELISIQIYFDSTFSDTEDYSSKKIYIIVIVDASTHYSILQFSLKGKED